MTSPVDLPCGGPGVPVGWSAHVPLSWHRRYTVKRDDRGRLVVDVLTDEYRAHPVGWCDWDDDGLLWVLG